MENSKCVVRSRQVWTIVSVALFGVIGAARQLGVDLPLGLEEHVDGVVQAGIGLFAAGVSTWSLLRPDNAKLTLLPHPTTNTPIGQAQVVKGALQLGVVLLALALTGCASDFGTAAFMRGDAMREHVLCEGDCTVTIHESGQSTVQTTGPASKVTYRYTSGGHMSPEARALAAQMLYIGQQVGAAYAGVPPGLVARPPDVPAPTLTVEQVQAIISKELEAFTAPALRDDAPDPESDEVE